MNRAATLFLLCTTALGCWQYRGGYCDANHIDCGSDATCDIHSNKCRLNKTDGGAGGAGGAKDGGHDATRDAARDSEMDKGPPHCVVDANTCSGATPLCDPNTLTCRGCEKDADCASLHQGKPACLIVGDGTGVCVDCTKDTHCEDAAAPVCNRAANTCTGCSTDGDCSRFGPGICRTFTPIGPDAGTATSGCVTDAETIYVQTNAACSDAPAVHDGGADAGVSGGTSSAPFCTMGQSTLNAISNNRNVIVVTGSVAAGVWTYADEANGNLLIAGRDPTALIGSSGAPAFNMSSGTVTIRGVEFTSLLSTGIQATGGMLTLDHVKVDSCKTGGILLNGASFDIENTTVTNNGVGMDGTTNWSGIYVKTVPAGSTKLYLSTIDGNKNAGVLCAGHIEGRDVLAYGNGGNVDIGSSLCNFESCGTPDGGGAGPACGAQP